MRLKKSNTRALKRAHSTLVRFDEYRNRLGKYVKALSGDSTAQFAARPPLFLLTHFTTNEHAKSIVKESKIKVNAKGYTSFTALSPIELKTATSSKRKWGFSFFIEDLSDFDPFTPVAHLNDNGIAKEITDLNASLAKKVLCEPTNTQPSLSFVNHMEIRVRQDIPLDRCSVFFQNERLEELAEPLNSLGIFRMPFTAEWFRDHLLTTQKWFLREDENFIEFFDNRVCDNSMENVISALAPYTENTQQGNASKTNSPFPSS